MYFLCILNVFRPKIQGQKPCVDSKTGSQPCFASCCIPSRVQLRRVDEAAVTHEEIRIMKVAGLI